MKEAGYASGIRRIDLDDEYWVHPGEMLVRKSDGGIRRTLNAGDGVIPADLTANLMEWGGKSPSEFLAEASAAAAEQSASVLAGILSLLTSVAGLPEVKAEEGDTE